MKIGKSIIDRKTIKDKMMMKKYSDILVGIRNRIIMKAKPTIMYRSWKPVAVMSVDFYPSSEAVKSAF